VPEILYPESEGGLPDQFAIRLFRMSSPLPPALVQLARQRKYVVSDGSRGFVFNGGLTASIDFLDIGTRQAR
jgi:hypothetical protein